MPRSFQLRNRLRLGLLALVLMVPFFIVGYHASAQKRRPAQTNNTQTSPAAQDQQKKNLTRLNSSETAEGSSITIFSDLPLNDYAAYRGGDRFYVLIPGADASRLLTSLRGRGFTDVRAQKRGNDVLLSFRLLAGAAARVSQKFNRLEILITVPALVTANASTNTTNTNSNTQTDPSQSTVNTNTGTTSPRTRSGSGRGSRGSGSYYPSESSTTGSSSTTGQTQAETNPNFNNPPDGIPVKPDGSVEQPGVSNYPPSPQTSPIVSPSQTAPGDQVAQVQPAPDLQGTSTDTGPTSATSTPSSGLTFGAQLKQNWLFVLLAIAIAGLIAWVIFARSRGEQSLVESRIETIRESRTEAKAVPAPIKVKAVPAPVKEKPVPEPLKEKPVPSPVKVDEAPTSIESPPAEVEAKSTSLKDLIAPAVVAAVVAGAVSEDSTQEAVEEKEIVEKEIVPEKPVAVEQASADVASLLSGRNYDEASIATEHPEARQMVAAELLAALSGRNVVRHERAREAFIKHGYFDDATRTLRTADSPGERASAARSLGLVRDTSGTPHLVAALEDSSPEVRRAAVESLAEVRDPSAVAPLEALRDREKNRKVPKALIQHAIEASVIGRTKVEPPAPVVPSYETSPLTADVAGEPLIETAPLSSDDYSAQTPEITEPLQAVESDYHVIEVESEASQVVALPEVEEAGVIEAATEALPYGEVTLDEPEKLESPATTEEAVLDLDEGTSDEWVDIDVGRPSTLSKVTSPPTAPVENIEHVLLEDASSGAVIAEPPVEVAEHTAEIVPVATEPPLLPFVATEAVIAGEASSVDERGLDVAGASDKEIEIVGGDHAGMSPEILRRLASEDNSERAAAVEELGSMGGEDSFREVSASFDDPSPDVRNAAARALYNLNPDRAASFTRALREASPERRRNIGGALSTSGLATEAIGNLMGESREKTYDAFSLLFLMAKAGEVQPLMRAVEEHPNNEVRLAVVKLLALSGQQDILPAFRRLAVRGSLPTEVRSAVMEAIYQISSQSSETSS